MHQGEWLHILREDKLEKEVVQTGPEKQRCPAAILQVECTYLALALAIALALALALAVAVALAETL